eukprot:1186917-Prorocentrum_minimum.AAC.1
MNTGSETVFVELLSGKCTRYVESAASRLRAAARKVCDSVGEPEVGTVCLVCQEASQETLACEICGGALHAPCVADHFAGVAVSAVNPCAFMCHACIILRLNEVYLTATVLE